MVVTVFAANLWRVGKRKYQHLLDFLNRKNIESMNGKITIRFLYCRSALHVLARPNKTFWLVKNIEFSMYKGGMECKGEGG